jgi:hypothetical protein
METTTTATDSFKTKSTGVLAIDTKSSLISRSRHRTHSLSTLSNYYRLNTRSNGGGCPSEHTATTATTSDI